MKPRLETLNKLLDHLRIAEEIRKSKNLVQNDLYISDIKLARDYALLAYDRIAIGERGLECYKKAKALLEKVPASERNIYYSLTKKLLQDTAKILQDAKIAKKPTSTEPKRAVQEDSKSTEPTTAQVVNLETITDQIRQGEEHLKKDKEENLQEANKLFWLALINLDKYEKHSNDPEKLIRLFVKTAQLSLEAQLKLDTMLPEPDVNCSYFILTILIRDLNDLVKRYLKKNNLNLELPLYAEITLKFGEIILNYFESGHQIYAEFLNIMNTELDSDMLNLLRNSPIAKVDLDLLGQLKIKIAERVIKQSIETSNPSTHDEKSETATPKQHSHSLLVAKKNIEDSLCICVTMGALAKDEKERAIVRWQIEKVNTQLNSCVPILKDNEDFLVFYIETFVATAELMIKMDGKKSLDCMQAFQGLYRFLLSTRSEGMSARVFVEFLLQIGNKVLLKYFDDHFEGLEFFSTKMQVAIDMIHLACLMNSPEQSDLVYYKQLKELQTAINTKLQAAQSNANSDEKGIPVANRADDKITPTPGDASKLLVDNKPASEPKNAAATHADVSDSKPKIKNRHPNRPKDPEVRKQLKEQKKLAEAAALREKQATEERERLAAEEKAKADVVAAERAALEKAEAERAVTAKAALEKMEAERAATAKAALEKAEAEKAATAKAALEKAEAERAATAKAALEKTQAERAAAEKDKTIKNKKEESQKSTSVEHPKQELNNRAGRQRYRGRRNNANSKQQSSSAANATKQLSEPAKKFQENSNLNSFKKPPYEKGRLAAEQRAMQEKERLAAKQRAIQEKERQAAEQRATQEKERLAVQESQPKSPRKSVTLQTPKATIANATAQAPSAPAQPVLTRILKPSPNGTPEEMLALLKQVIPTYGQTSAQASETPAPSIIQPTNIENKRSQPDVPTQVTQPKKSFAFNPNAKIYKPLSSIASTTSSPQFFQAAPQTAPVASLRVGYLAPSPPVPMNHAPNYLSQAPASYFPPHPGFQPSTNAMPPMQMRQMSQPLMRAAGANPMFNINNMPQVPMAIPSQAMPIGYSPHQQLPTQPMFMHRPVEQHQAIISLPENMTPPQPTIENLLATAKSLLNTAASLFHQQQARKNNMNPNAPQQSFSYGDGRK